MTNTRKKEDIFNKLKKLKVKGYVNESAPPVLFLLGMYAGRKIVVEINKRMDETKVSKIFGIGGKTLLSAGSILGGLTLAQLSQKKEFQYLGWGVAGLGFSMAGESLWKRTALQGMDDDIRLPGEYLMMEGPQDALELNLEDMDAAMKIIENSVDEKEVHHYPVEEFSSSIQGKENDSQTGTVDESAPEESINDDEDIEYY